MHLTAATKSATSCFDLLPFLHFPDIKGNPQGETEEVVHSFCVPMEGFAILSL